MKQVAIEIKTKNQSQTICNQRTPALTWDQEKLLWGIFFSDLLCCNQNVYISSRYRLKYGEKNELDFYILFSTQSVTSFKNRQNIRFARNVLRTTTTLFIFTFSHFEAKMTQVTKSIFHNWSDENRTRFCLANIFTRNTWKIL